MSKRKCLITEEGRECTKCGEFKEWAEFDISSREKTGHICICKTCSRSASDGKRRRLGIPRRGETPYDTNGRTCTRCLIFKSWSDFGKHPKGLNGRRSICKECKSLDNSKRNKGRPPKQTEEEKRHKRAEYYQSVKERDREKRAEYQRGYKKNNPSQRLRSILSCRIYDALSRVDTYKSTTTVKLIGCQPKYLLEHLNSTSNYDYGDSGIEVDHIIPCNYFDLENEIEQYICFNWRNLQLLTKKENLEKSDTLPDNGDALYAEILEAILSVHPAWRGEMQI